MWAANQISKGVASGDFRSVAKAISCIENGHPYAHELLQLPSQHTRNIIGITGPPGAGKSTLTDDLIRKITASGKSVAVLCVDPSSSFHTGALLGDRIRMSDWYNTPSVYIRSLATRGALGGLHPFVIEVTTLLQASTFDYIIIETVGVGQSEIEIASLADFTVVVLVPEAGDDIQAMKSGLMEVASLFVVNKADRPGADIFINNLRNMMAPEFHGDGHQPPVLKTNALTMEGVSELYEAILHGLQEERSAVFDRIMLEKVIRLVQHIRMKGIDRELVARDLKEKSRQAGFNIFNYANSIA
jgi:LAO/AO transport system kinase